MYSKHVYIFVCIIVYILLNGCNLGSKRTTESIVKEAQQLPDTVRTEKISTLRNEAGTFVDSRDGKTYKWVKIGSQIWMAENLAYMPLSGSYCYNKSADSLRFGRYYELTAITKELCPVGWHLPSDDEYKELLKLRPEHSANGLNESQLWIQLLENNGFLDSESLKEGYVVYNYQYEGSQPHWQGSEVSGKKSLPYDYYDPLRWWSYTQTGGSSLPNKIMIAEAGKYAARHYLDLGAWMGQENSEGLPERNGNEVRCYPVRCIKDIEQMPSKPSTINDYLKKGVLLKVISDKAYFYANPSESSIKKSYLITDEQITVQEVQGDFIYVEFTNKQGKVTKGWMKWKEFSDLSGKYSF